MTEPIAIPAVALLLRGGLSDDGASGRGDAYMLLDELVGVDEVGDVVAVVVAVAIGPGWKSFSTSFEDQDGRYR